MTRPYRRTYVVKRGARTEEIKAMTGMEAISIFVEKHGTATSNVNISATIKPRKQSNT